ncbi:MAG: hypothetical protein Kow00108_14600 [Calditrichia bacterium]
MKKFYLIQMLLGIILLSGCMTMNKSKLKFGIAYGKIEFKNESSYNLLIVEPDHYTKPEIDALKQKGIKVIAYLSLGEVDPYRWYFPYLKERGFLGMNPDWNSYYINLADKKTIELMLNKVLPNIMIKGFDGLFFDTVDAVAPYTEHRDLKDEMVNLIKKIREKYPRAYLIQNAGLFLIDETAPYIDGLLLEDVATGYDFKTNQYILKDEKEFSQRLSILEEIYRKYKPDIYIVDYADTPDRKREVEKRLQRTPFYWFIGKIELQTLPE